MEPKQSFTLNIPDTTLAGMVKRRAAEATKHWEKKYDLTKVRQANAKLYTTEYVKERLIDQRYEDIFADNRLFVSVRTVLPFVVSRLTQPEVVPANGSDVADSFAADFEKVLVQIGQQQFARDKVKLAVQDLLMGKRLGVLKWRYDSKQDGLVLDHIDPEDIIIDGKTHLHEEPKFVQHAQKRTVGEMLRMFPDKKDTIFKLLNIQKGTSSQLERSYRITENWLYVDDDNGDSHLIAVWDYQGNVLGKVNDPNFIEGKDNVVDNPMMPFIFFNFLNDGSGYIDHTSFIEQASYNQKNYDRRGQTIAENAQYGGVGVPVFGKDAITAETAAKVQFNPTQRILLDTADVSKSFTTWNTDALPQYIVEDKIDLRNNIDNIFGTPNILRAEQSTNQTATQDAMLRDQAQNRQQELVDCIDNGMQRFYQLEAQLVYRYFDSEDFFNFIGEDGQFEEVVISSDKIKQNLGIRVHVQAGTSLPVDRSQKRATAMELAKANKLGTLKLYKELGLDNPEEAFKQHIMEQIYPLGLLQEVEDTLFDREAERDLQMVIAGKVPEQRDDLTDSYINHLNEYLLTEAFDKLTTKQQQQVSDFVNAVVVQAKRKVQKMSQMQPTGLQPDIPSLDDMMKLGWKRTLREDINYKDTPPDIQRQMEDHAGFQPSQLGSVTPTLEHLGPNNPTQGFTLQAKLAALGLQGGDANHPPL